MKLILFGLLAALSFSLVTSNDLLKFTDVHGNYCGYNKNGNGGTQQPVDALDSACKAHDECYGTHGFMSCGCDNQLIKAARPLRKVSGKPGKQAKKIVAFFRLLPCRGAQTVRFPALCKSRKKILGKRITIRRPCIKRTCKVIPFTPALKRTVKRLSCKKIAPRPPTLAPPSAPVTRPTPVKTPQGSACSRVSGSSCSKEGQSCGCGFVCRSVARNTKVCIPSRSPPKPTPRPRPTPSSCSRAGGSSCSKVGQPCSCGLVCSLVAPNTKVCVRTGTKKTPNPVPVPSTDKCAKVQGSRCPKEGRPCTCGMTCKLVHTNTRVCIPSFA